MTHVSPTVTDVSRAVAELDRHAARYKPDDEINRVASNLAYRFSLHNGWGGRTKVTTRDVRAALIAHGASPFTVEQFARRIASRIRADFSDGRSVA